MKEMKNVVGPIIVTKDIKDTEIYVGGYLQDYPVVYIYYNKVKDKYDVYIGETIDFIRRDKQHQKESIFHDLKQVYIILNKYFNKSLTEDIENKLILYLSSANNINYVYNKRTNPQKEYYSSEKLDEVFKQIWDELHKKDNKIFINKREIENSILFKASPFHKLNTEQLKAKELIMDKINSKLSKDTINKKEKNVIWVNGGAGTGKSVLLSNLFYDLLNRKKNRKSAIVVNHDEQFTAYTDIANKLKLKGDESNKLVYKSTTFINEVANSDEIFDVVLIDEGHLLWTKKTQKFTDKNNDYEVEGPIPQLSIIAKHAKVVVYIFDQKQIVRSNQYVDSKIINEKIEEAKKENRYISFEKQMRINADKKTIDWIDSFTKKQIIKKIPKDSKKYEIKIFENPKDLYEAIKEKNEQMDEEKKKQGLCRLVATYDWKYVKNNDKKDLYYVDINYIDKKGKKEKFKKLWNWETKKLEPHKRTNNSTWAELEFTIDEVGSIYTVQGSDLNYVGVILGKSVTYKDGKIEFNPEFNKNKDVYGSLERQKELVANEVSVLLTRGYRGLYIYAEDEALRNALLEKQI